MERLLMPMQRRQLAALLSGIVALQGCTNLEGGPTDSPDLPAIANAALPKEDRSVILVQRVEWGQGRARVMPLFNPFEPVMSDRAAKAGVLAATARGVYFLDWNGDASSYGISNAWAYPDLAGAELRRFGASRTVVLRRKNGAVDAFWLMKNRYVQDAAGTEALQAILARQVEAAGASNLASQR